MSGRMKRALKTRVRAAVTRRDELARFLAGKARTARRQERPRGRVESRGNRRIDTS
jgi:hypothetical protein